MHWQIRLPYAGLLAVSLPIIFGLLAVSVFALPPRIQPEEILAPAAIVLWVVWLFWAYPSAEYRNGEYVIRNPLRTSNFSSSSRIRVTGQHAPTFHLDSARVQPIVMLAGSASVVATAHASTGVDRGVNVVPMERLRPGHEDGAETSAAVKTLQAECDIAGDRDPLIRRSWNLAGIALTVALLGWAVMSLI